MCSDHVGHAFEHVELIGRRLGPWSGGKDRESRNNLTVGSADGGTGEECGVEDANQKWLTGRALAIHIGDHNKPAFFKH